MSFAEMAAILSRRRRVTEVKIFYEITYASLNFKFRVFYWNVKHISENHPHVVKYPPERYAKNN